MQIGEKLAARFGNDLLALSLKAGMKSKRSAWTAPRLPVEPIHWEVLPTRQETIQPKKNLKTGFGREWLKRQYKSGRLAAESRQACAWIDRAIIDEKEGQVGEVGYQINFYR